jgi:DNA-binding MarR family transcriptional regulator
MKADAMDVEQRSFEALRRIIRSSDVHSRALLKKHSLTSPQLSVLKSLQNGGAVPIGALAKTTFLGPATVTGVVDRLEDRGWATRVHGQDDRRQVLIQITAAGKRVLKKKPPLLHDMFCKKLLQMTKSEQQQICDVLQQVAGMMEDASLDGGNRLA